MRKKSLNQVGIIAASFLILALATGICGAQEKKIEVVFTSASVAPSPGVALGDAFKETLEWMSSEPVEVKHFPASQMGKALEQLDGVMTGEIHMMAEDLGLFENVLPKLKVFSMPYLIKGPEHFMKVIKSDIGKQLSNELVKTKGIRLIGICPRAPRHLTSNRPIYTPADLKGFKIRIPNFPTFIKIWRRLGANPTPVAWAEVYTTLALGTADGQENPVSTFYAAKLHEVQKYCTLTAHLPGSHAVVANEKWFSSQSKDMQDAIYLAVDNAAQYASRLALLMEQGRIRLVEKAGMTIIKPDLKPWREKVADLYKEFSGDFSEDLYRAIEKMGES